VVCPDWNNAGHRIPFKGIDVLVVTAVGKHITTPVKGGGAPNPYCKDTQPMKWARTDEDNSENGNAVGLLFTYGKFRMLQLARAGRRAALAGGPHEQRRQKDRSPLGIEAPARGAGDAGTLPVALFRQWRDGKSSRRIHRQHRAGLERPGGWQVAQGVGGP
jgi:hypothetical protein